MKKYQTKPEIVEACQFTGTKESFDGIRDWIGVDFHYDYQEQPTVFLNQNGRDIGIEEGFWIVKTSDLEGGFEYVIMRDDQFHDKYGVLGQVTTY